MKEQLISFETAALAKEKGFDIDCKLFYSTKDRPPMAYNISAKESLSDNPQYNKYMLAPTQSLLAKWLRDTHNIRVFCTFETIDDSETAWIWNIVSDNVEGKGRKKDTWDFYDRKDCFSEMTWFEDYEECFEAGLYRALKSVS